MAMSSRSSNPWQTSQFQPLSLIPWSKSLNSQLKIGKMKGDDINEEKDKIIEGEEGRMRGKRKRN